MSVSAFYVGAVTHARLRPAQHHLRYRIVMGLFDLDELQDLARRSWAFGFNRPGLFAFYDRDHGDGSGAPLRPQIAAALREHDMVCDGAISVLCMPRILGYVFNPLCIYFCHDRTGRLVALVHEVNNTFGERHFYVLAAEPGADGRVAQACDKAFRVSPFLPMALKYHFSVRQPGADTGVAITVSDDRGVVLTASFNGARRRFTTAEILRLWLTHPALTFQVFAGIHWEAVWIWLKLRRAARSAAGSQAAAP